MSMGPLSFTFSTVKRSTFIDFLDTQTEHKARTRFSPMAHAAPLNRRSLSLYLPARCRTVGYGRSLDRVCILILVLRRPPCSQKERGRKEINPTSFSSREERIGSHCNLSASLSTSISMNPFDIGHLSSVVKNFMLRLRLQLNEALSYWTYFMD
ncbi:hypothetical protein NE237_007636 [Protea cynaroides]|uniref:Uncharacterized protein n=1 Tax=Protea cynaroides TaxID=273540 RepID=A0A9Q0KPR8_9MAGN|nr:hypothetical protein NE237_007636 [Protea cynaroides]